MQDLEKQLHLAKRQLQHYRSMIPKGEDLMSFETSSQVLDELPDSTVRLDRRLRSPMGRDYVRVRSNMRNYGRGIMKIYNSHREKGSKDRHLHELPGLPPKSKAERLLQNYYEHLHNFLPIIHWPIFYDQFLQTYQRGDLQGHPNAWIALFFNLLACGSLFSLEKTHLTDAEEYFKIATRMVDLGQDDFSLDHVRSALLSSIVLFELNLKSASSIWLGSATRIAQDIALHTRSSNGSPLDEEMKRRVWYCIYVWDR